MSKTPTPADFPVAITDEALAQVKKLIARKGEPGCFVRLGVKGGGCSGLEYVFRLDTKPSKFDLSKRIDDVEFVCDAKSAAFLNGATLVWTGNLIGGGFSFENPNAERSCGCGTSFTPKASS